MSDTENSPHPKINISLNVSIPYPGQPGQPIEIKPVGVEHAARPRQVQPAPQPVALEQGHPRRRYAVVRPTANEEWPVKVLTSGGFGIVCAWGSTSGISPDPDKVLGHCFDGVPTANPPSGADSCPVAGGAWKLNAVPGARAGVNNILKVWYTHVSLGVLRTEEVPFQGIHSDQTFCEMIGSGSGGASKESFRHVYLPLLLVAEAGGFSSGLKHFNGVWPLQLIPSAAETGRVAWRHRRESRSSPLVRLTVDAKKGGAVLLFKHRDTEIRYRKRGGHFNPVNVCDFAEVSCRSVSPRESVPAIVQVRPGTSP